MAAELIVEIVKTETIKPSFPTPNELKTVTLSLLDQLEPALHVHVLLFFSKTTLELTNQNRSKLLSDSLSETVSSFRPFAGRIRGNHSIECSDEGSEFAETKVSSRLSDVLVKPDPESLTKLLPSARDQSEKVPLLLVQVNFFECGGLAIGVSVSHKIADAATISHFLNCWASKTSNTRKFVSPPRFPPHDSLADLCPQPLPPAVASTRLVFHGPRISTLRAKLSGPDGPKPTRVEAVLALIWKCGMEASKSGGRSRQSVMYQAVNLRRTLSLGEKTPGNFAWNYSARCNNDYPEAELRKHLVAVKSVSTKLLTLFG